MVNPMDIDEPIAPGGMLNAVEEWVDDEDAESRYFVLSVAVLHYLYKITMILYYMSGLNAVNTDMEEGENE